MPIARLSTGIDCYYEIGGSGEPLLLIMGTSSDHCFWEAQRAAYEARYRTIVYDARGTGQSSQPEDVENYTMALLADDAAALLDALGIELAHVSGISLGSTTAQELALRHPEKVGTLQLHGTWGARDRWFQYVIGQLKYPIEREDRVGFAKAVIPWVLSPAAVNDPKIHDAIVEALLTHPHVSSFKGILGHIHADETHHTMDRLPSVKVPTLITSGELDWQVPPRLGYAVHKAIPHSELHMFTGPHSSHSAFFEMPDEFNRVTLDWWRRHPLVRAERVASEG
jgi:pimeloyl-ACP methyl ester carboxylesterase